MNIREILQRRETIRVELRALIDAHPETMPAEQEARFNALTTEADGLVAQESRLAVVAGIEARQTGRPVETHETRAPLTVRAFGRDVGLPAGFDGRVETAQDGSRVPLLTRSHNLTDFLPPDQRHSEIGFGQFLRALYNGPQSEVERRAMGEASVGAGGAFVPTPLSAALIDLYRAHAVSFQAGAVTVPMDSASLKFGQLTADPVGGWRAEGASVAVGTPTFANVTLQPKSWALLVQVSRELLMDGQNTSGLLEGIFARVGAVALDQAVLYGTGASNQPLGIANTSGIQLVSMGTNGAALTNYSPFLDGIKALELANAGTVSAAIMNPRTAREMNGLTNTLNDWLRPPARLANIPMLSTTSMPVTETQGTAVGISSSVLLGDFSQVLVGLRHGLQVSVLNERYADTGQVGFVVHLRADVLVARPSALCRIAGVL